MIASAQGGNPDTATKNIFITTKEDPIACFEIIEIGNNGFVPSTVIFQNCSEFATKYIWDFGDGTIDSSMSINSISHTFIFPGTFEIKLKVIDNLGNIREHLSSIIIKEGTSFIKDYSYEREFGYNNDEGWDLIQYENGNFLIVGKARTNGLHDGVFFLELDSQGSIIRSEQGRFIDGKELKEAYSISKSRDGNF